jgi:adenylosuccinate lyase
LLALGGHPEAHEVIKQVTLSCENEGISFVSALKQQSEAWNIITAELSAKTGLDADRFFSDPSLYRGKAAERALAVARTYKLEMKRMGGIINGTNGDDEL